MSVNRASPAIDVRRDDEWVMDLSVLHTIDGKYVACIHDVRLLDLSTDESNAQRMRRLAKYVMEASRHIMLAADEQERLGK